MTTISWTHNPATGDRGKTWNPVTGCSAVSTGCLHCYAVVMTRRLAGMKSTRSKYAGLVSDVHFTGKVLCHEDVLREPLKVRKPTTFFVCSMSDLLHESVPFEFLDKVFAVMALCPQHIFQLLTKRPERMAEYLCTSRRLGKITPHMNTMVGKCLRGRSVTVHSLQSECWPFPNVWLGVSVEDQKACVRIEDLIRCPAAVRFLSVEPLLGPVDLLKWLQLGDALWDHNQDEHQHSETTGMAGQRDTRSRVNTSSGRRCGTDAETRTISDTAAMEGVASECAIGGGTSRRSDPIWARAPRPTTALSGSTMTETTSRQIADGAPCQSSPRINRTPSASSPSAKNSASAIGNETPASTDERSPEESRAACLLNKPCPGSRIGWVLIGGESGPKARPFNLEWAYDLIDQCRSANVAVFVKQLGSCARLQGEPYPRQHPDDRGNRADPRFWPKKLQIQEYPQR